MADTANETPQLRLPTLAAEDGTPTSSPARGAEMKNFLQARLQKNRAPPLKYTWDFYHDRQDRSHSTNLSNAVSSNPESASSSEHTGTNGSTPPAGKRAGGVADYEARLEHLAVIDDIRKFWNVFNNFPLTLLALRDSIHLFHSGTKPVWEDPRNVHGGSWTFRVPKAHAEEFWKQICLMAIGNTLQDAVEDPQRTRFQDDICGVSLGVRFNSMLIQIWNRDGSHEAGVQRVLETVLDGLADELQPREGSYYYKKHSEHAGFSAPVGPAGSPSSTSSGSRPTSSMGQQLQEHGGSIDAVLGEGS
ncbi:hypothetical protein D0860_07542 [Hortaea werneckii]|uniref:Translation initiation factor eIF4e n=1 Tax=Hortaea werneckii TaxID=91943 RepID=A0A3M7GK65_HORWE|nr:hypothetical protein D0860_07542 [Hortaea werneckii]